MQPVRIARTRRLARLYLEPAIPRRRGALSNPECLKCVRTRNSSDDFDKLNVKADEEFLKHLLSKRREFGPRTHRFSWLDITSADREKLYEIAEECGFLTHYEFSGIKSAGTSRNNAALRLLQATRDRAFSRLKHEFGAKAHFWVRPRQLCLGEIDFYWRKAKVGVIITGPLLDARGRAGPQRARDRRLEYDFTSTLPTELKGLTVLRFPYYEVWHQPAGFIKQIRQGLVASGHYPRLSA